MRTPHLASILLLLLTVAPWADAQESEYLYWTIHDRGEVWRSLTDGTFTERLTSSERLRAMGVDGVQQNLYYGTEVENEGAIYRANLDGTNRRRLISTPQSILAVLVDSTNSQIFWSEENGSSGRLFRANLDFGNPQLLPVGVAFDPAMAVDTDSDQLYVSLSGSSNIGRMDFDGGNLVTLIAPQHFDLAIDSASDILFLSTATTIEACDLHIDNCVTLASGLDSPDLEIANGTLYYEESGNLFSMDFAANNVQQVTTSGDLSSEIALDATQGRLYWGIETIFSSNLSGNDRLPILGTARDLHDVAVDPQRELLYFGDSGSRALHVTDLANIEIFPMSPTISLVNDLNNARGIALDPVNEHLYWVDLDSMSQGLIGRLNTDGTGFTSPVTDLDKPHDIALDLAGGKIYWNTSVGSGDDSTVSIQRADLDGTNIETLHSGLPARVRGVAVDNVNGKLYWTDMTNNELWRSDLDGSSPEFFFATGSRPHDVAVDVAAGWVYWTEGITDSNSDVTGKIRRVDLSGSSAIDVQTGLPGTLRDLIVVTHRDLFLFEDGFETGDSLNWSSSIP